MQGNYNAQTNHMQGLKDIAIDILAFGEIMYIQLISARMQGNYNASTNHMQGLKDIANLVKKYRLSAESGISS